jgi:hypothetical protein
MVENHCTGNPCPVKTSNQPPLADCKACALLAKAIDTTELAQAGFNELGALCQAIRHTCDKHTNPYHLAGIGQYLADDWVNTLDGELEMLKALRRAQQ